MSLNAYLASRIPDCKEVVEQLTNQYEYVSILGSYTKMKTVATSTHSTTVNTNESECGFVIKVYNGQYYSEYACNDVRGLDLNKVRQAMQLNTLKQDHVKAAALQEEELTRSFERVDPNPVNPNEILKRLEAVKEKVQQEDERFINVQLSCRTREVSKIFVSSKKCLDQFYSWTNCGLVIVVRDENNMKRCYSTSNELDTDEAIKGLEESWQEKAAHAIAMLKAKPIVPGYYDVITDSSITGLIAHEAFGHGVEMDMFVKDRAKAKNYVNRQVASPLINMHDGAGAVVSAASYFFDDDGILAGDTQIIKDGILINGISDALSALQLGTTPTGNGRREAFTHKSYTRMTNTFFSEGESDLEDMIASVDYGYMLFDCNNGMEDPKNWQIQCVAEYGLEIKDGKFTGEIVAPVVISGSVLDLLNSITMVSKNLEVIGSGGCGKGHKEWVYVSDGGPCMIGKAKLG